MGVNISSSGISYDDFVTTRDKIINEIQSLPYQNIQNLGFESYDVLGGQVNSISLAITELATAFVLSVNQIDPTQAQGVNLDKLRWYFGVGARQGSSNTIQDIQVTTDRALLLPSTFQVSDNNKNNYIISAETNIATAGTHTVTFKAVNTGVISPALNTIKTINTPVLGVLSVNNSTAPTQIGENSESDASYSARMILSRSSEEGTGIIKIQTALTSLASVSYAKVYQNNTLITQNGIPWRHIYCVVDGSATSQEIVQTIGKANTDGVPTHGWLSDIYEYNTGLYQTIYYDVVSNTSIYVRINVASSGSISENAMKEYLVNNLKKQVSESLFAGDVAKYAEMYLGSNGGVTDCDVSIDGITWIKQLSVTDLKTRFVLDVNKITINIT